MPSVPTRIKICGITRHADALAAAQAGADAIGMVFYPGARRCISPEIAAQILRVLPPFVTPVALFVDQDLDEIQRIARDLQIRHVQLHGHETPEMVAALRQFTILKALRSDRATLGPELAMWREAIESLDLRHLGGLVMETPGAPGGSGIANDFGAIAELQRSGAFEGLPPLIAAGGLTPENVGGVVKLLRPYAVDVSSGVEATLGEKSSHKIDAFIEAVRAAD